jgi:hypothetical protein
MTVHEVSPAEGSAEPRPLTPPQRPPSRGFSMRPAMLVLGLGALILIVFIILGALTTGKVQTTNTSKATSAVAGTDLRRVPAASALAVITASGEPPSDILNAVSIPVGSHRISHQSNSGSAGQFDAQIGLVTDSSQLAVENFYRADMRAQGWQVFATGPASHDPGANEVLGKKAGTDGFYWEMGAVVSATTFGPHAPPRGETTFTVRLFQVPDPA